MKHDEAYELIDAYVLGTLSEAERAGVEEHLAGGCPACDARMAEAGEVVVELARGLERLEPSPEVKRSLMMRVAGQSIPDARASGRRSRSAVWPIRALAVLSSAAVVAMFFWGVSLNKKVEELHSRAVESEERLARLLEDNAVQNEAAILLGKPCTKLVDLKGVEPNPQAFAKMFLHPEETVAVLYAYQLPVVPSDRRYQVWVKQNDSARAVGSFTVREDGSALLEFRGLPPTTTIDSFIVTIEPVEGVSQPSGMTYLLGSNPLRNIH